MSKDKPRLIFIKKSDNTFVLKDEIFLSNHFNLVSLSDHNAAGLKQLWTTAIIIFQLLWYLPRSKFIFIWLGDYHSFFPVLLARLFKVKSILVLGGQEADVIPSLNYGVFNTKFRAFFAGFAIRNANILLPVDESMIQGIHQYAGKIEGKIITIPTGYNSENWFCNTPKKNQILSVASFDNINRIKLKGLHFFAKLAQQMPDYEFLIAGAAPGAINFFRPIPPNLSILGRKNSTALRMLYSESKVYCQFSLSEGLPNVLCEAMLCECIPIGTKVRGIPNAIGETGYLIEVNDLSAAQLAIEKAINDPISKGKICRTRVIEQFNNLKREQALLHILKPT